MLIFYLTYIWVCNFLNVNNDHITEYIANSALVGLLPRITLMRSYSSCLSPSSFQGCSFLEVFFAYLVVSTAGVFTMHSPTSSLPTWRIANHQHRFALQRLYQDQSLVQLRALGEASNQQHYLFHFSNQRCCSLNHLD